MGMWQPGGAGEIMCVVASIALCPALECGPLGCHVWDGAGGAVGGRGLR